MTHTPAPWIWGHDHKGLYGAGPNNEVLSHASYEGMWLSTGDTKEDNASLISAAPELLEALRAVELARHTDTEADWGTATRLTDAALAKAEGRE